VAATVRELVLQGQLAPLQIVRPDRCLDSGEIAQDPVAALREHAPGERAVVFASSVRAAIAYADAYRAEACDATVVHGDLPWHARQEAVKSDIVCNVMCLTEGWDDPGVSVCVLARGCSSSGSLIQMTGRVMRPAPWKERALLIDLRGVTHVFGDPTEDMEYSLKGIGIRPKGAQVLFCACCAAPIGAYPCIECGHTPPEPELPRVVNAEIKFAGKRSESVAERRATWHRWVAEAKAKGWKIGSVLYKYKAVYGHWPPKEVMR
jgi:DNA repair protein RadD